MSSVGHWEYQFKYYLRVHHFLTDSHKWLLTALKKMFISRTSQLPACLVSSLLPDFHSHTQWTNVCFDLPYLPTPQTLVFLWGSYYQHSFKNTWTFFHFRLKAIFSSHYLPPVSLVSNIVYGQMPFLGMYFYWFLLNSTFLSFPCLLPTPFSLPTRSTMGRWSQFSQEILFFSTLPVD